LTLIALATLISVALTVASPVYAEGSTQIYGVGFFNDGRCVLGDADYVNVLEGDLDGCLYVYVEFAKCSPGDIYRERGTNIFKGWYNGEYGEFEATYQFMGKFEECNVEEGPEFFGRCHHPIIKGSGTGAFEGVNGQLDFKDNVEGGVVLNFPYRGHLRW
jgi:hypothetical protein